MAIQRARILTIGSDDIPVVPIMAPFRSMILDSQFYSQSTLQVARQLLGKLLVRQLGDTRLSGVIVEVESYLSRHDSASHSYRGPNKKNRSMYLEAGRLYVYPIHAKYCLNVVTEPEGQGAAVLIRALEPYEGIERLAENRKGATERDWMRGPSRLCQAMQVDRSLDGIDLKLGEEIWIESPTTELPPFRCARSSRIGISSAQDKLLRLFVDGNRFVSGLARHHTKPPKSRLVST